MPKREVPKWIDLGKPPSGHTASGVGSKQYATYVVAAADSTPSGRANADYVCTGSNDEATISEAMAARGLSRVLLLEGHYKIDSTIQMQTGVILEGQGDATVLEMSSTFSTSGEMIIGASNSSLRNLKIDGGNRAHINTIRLDTFVNVSVENVSMVNLDHWRGFSLYGGGSDIRIVGLRVDGSNASQAFIDQYAATDLEFRRLEVHLCRFANMTGPLVIQVYGDEENGTSKLPPPDEMTVQEIAVTGNVLRSDGSCTFFAGVSANGLNISANTLGTVDNGVQFTDCFNVTVAGNQITIATIGVSAQNSYYADDRGGSQFFAITGNTIWNCSQCVAVVGPPNSDGDGTREAEDYRTFGVISGNSLGNGGEGCISIGTASRVTITGNTITIHNLDGDDTAGIEIVQSWELVISGNVFSGHLVGILCTESEAVLITGNHFNNDGIGMGAGIRIHTACNDIKIAGNYFNAAGQFNIDLPNTGGGSIVEIVGNTFDNATYAIFSSNTGNQLVVWNNIIRGGQVDLGTPATPPVVRENLTALGTFQDALRAGPSSGAQIAAGVATLTADDGYLSSWILLEIQTGATSDLTGFIGDSPTAGNIYIFSVVSGDTVTVKASSFHLAGGADCVLDSIYDRLVMHYTGSAWVELSRSSNT